MTISNNGAKPMKSVKDWLYHIEMATGFSGLTQWWHTGGKGKMAGLITLVQADALASVATQPSSGDEKLVHEALTNPDWLPHYSKECMTAFKRIIASRSTHNAEWVRNDALEEAARLVESKSISSNSSGAYKLLDRLNGDTHSIQYAYAIRDLKSKASPSQHNAEWLPIETAPKDVTHILTYNKKLGKMRVDYWDASDPEGPFLGDPDLWMPLPAAPKEG